MSLPVGMYRRAFNYDDALEDPTPMTPPPSNMCSNVLWKQPVIPERKYEELCKVCSLQSECKDDMRCLTDSTFIVPVS